MGHKKPRAPKIQLKVTVLSEHRMMLRALSMYYKRNMGDVLGELIEAAWEKIRTSNKEVYITKLYKKNMKVFLEHELLADKMILFDLCEYDDTRSIFIVLQRALASVKTVFQRLIPSWFTTIDDDRDYDGADNND